MLYNDDDPEYAWLGDEVVYLHVCGSTGRYAVEGYDEKRFRRRWNKGAKTEITIDRGLIECDGILH